jgi:hypothetical protein
MQRRNPTVADKKADLCCERQLRADSVVEQLRMSKLTADFS